MDIEVIKKEIKSPALRTIVQSLCTLIDRVKNGEITYQQGSTEIAGHKHVIQALALDWMFSKKTKSLTKVEG
jgi:hypothetical protein